MSLIPFSGPLSREAQGDANKRVDADFVPEKVVALKHPWRIVGALLTLIVVAALVKQCITQPGFQWDVVRKYLFEADVVHGVRVTIILTVTAMAIAVVLGLMLALMRESENKALKFSSSFFIWAFRGTPVLVQLVFWFNLAILFPTIDIGIPFIGPTFFSTNANEFITPLLAANLGLGLCEAAYMAEIMRAGINSVDEGQLQAAQAVGMRKSQALRKVVLPQAMRVIIPPTGNETIGMLKYTSLASVITVSELLTSVQSIYQRTFQIIPLLIVASIWYLIITSVLTVGQRALERRFNRGTKREYQSQAPSRYKLWLAKLKPSGDGQVDMLNGVKP
jgi:polar amino acid transport system permease protein